jgi:TatD DNase family protein
LKRVHFVGEVGLDYSIPDSAARARQRAIFSKILECCAAHGGKTITVHSRRAAADTVAAIGDGFPGRVVMHWYSGPLRELQRAIQYGLFFSVNPAMIRSESGRRLVAAMPMERVITESDGPFVHNGRRPADPASTPTVLNFLSELWRQPLSVVAQTVLKNSGLGASS